MAEYNINTTEITRRINISNFLQGLLDENNETETTPEPMTSLTTLRLYEKPRTKPKKLVTKLKTKFIAEKKARCKYEYAQLQFLPSEELRAFRAHPRLLEEQKEYILRIPFSIHNIKHNDTLVNIYTGIPVANAFFDLVNMFPKEHIRYYDGWVVGQLTVKQQLLMTLVKLRLGLTDTHLSQRFRCSMETVENTLYTWIFTIHEMMFDTTVAIYGSLRDSTALEGPMILQNVTVYREIPDNPHLPHATPSEPYNSVLLSTVDGFVVYAGDLYRWICDKVDVLQYCGVLNTLLPGDVVAITRDIRLDLPRGVSSSVVDKRSKRLNDSREDLVQRMLQYNVLKSIPPGLWECATTMWQVVVSLMNYSRSYEF